MKLPEKTLNFILAQWEKLQLLLSGNSEMTHEALLKALYPTVVAAYDAVVQETQAQEKAPNICDYAKTLHKECTAQGYYLLPFGPQEGIAEHQGEVCRSYLFNNPKKPLPKGTVEISQFIFKLLRAENWAKQTESEHWFLLQAFSLLQNSTRLDWEEGMPLEGRQALWQRWLVAAIRQGSVFIVVRLLSLGASVGMPMDETLKTPLHYFCEMYLYYPDLATVTAMAEVLLTHHSCQPNVYDAMGNTPLLQWTKIECPPQLGPERKAMAESVLAALCMHGADINLCDGKTSRSILDKMVERNDVEGFVLAVAYGAKECRNMPEVLEWCDMHLHASQKQGVFKRLKQNSITWAWWLGLPQWQQSEGGRPVQGVSSGLFSLPTALWKVWEQTAFDLPPAKIEEIVAESPVMLSVVKEKHGRRPVKAVQYHEVQLHIKARPEIPAIEFAVATLLNRLFGDLVAPSDCLAITDNKKQVHAVLFSQTAMGTMLSDVLENPEKNTSFYEHLDKRQTSAQILGAMLIHPEDGKPNNHMLMEHILADGTEANRIIAIDNDHAFVNPLTEDGILQVKSILFCLESMREPVHPAWRDRIIGLSVEQFLQEWAKEVDEYQAQAHRIFDKKTRGRLQDVGAINIAKGFFGAKDAELPVMITFPLDEAAVTALWERFTQLQAILRHTPTITHLALLKKLSPTLGKLYGKAFDEFPLHHQTGARFSSLSAKSYGKEGEIGSTTKAVQKAMSLSKKQKKALDE